LFEITLAMMREWNEPILINSIQDLKKKIKEEASALRNKAEELEVLAEDKLSDMTKDIKQKVDAMKDHN
jgi:hypothetical protein